MPRQGKHYSRALTWFRQAKVLAQPDKQADIDKKMAEVQRRHPRESVRHGKPAGNCSTAIVAAIAPQSMASRRHSIPERRASSGCFCTERLPRLRNRCTAQVLPVQYRQTCTANRFLSRLLHKPQDIQFHQPVTGAATAIGGQSLDCIKPRNGLRQQ